MSILFKGTWCSHSCSLVWLVGFSFLYGADFFKSSHTSCTPRHVLQHKSISDEGEANVFQMLQLVNLHCLLQSVFMGDARFIQQNHRLITLAKLWRCHVLLPPILFPWILQVFQHEHVCFCCSLQTPCPKMCCFHDHSPYLALGWCAKNYTKVDILL